MSDKFPRKRTLADMQLQNPLPKTIEFIRSVTIQAKVNDENWEDADYQQVSMNVGDVADITGVEVTQRQGKVYLVEFTKGGVAYWAGRVPDSGREDTFKVYMIARGRRRRKTKKAGRRRGTKRK